MTSDAAHFDSAHFRSVMGRVPTSVVVVTGLDETGAPFGITIGSFTSVSLDPPLVGFLPGTGSRSWSAMRGSRRFCVNVLAADQSDLCWLFAKEGDAKFAGIQWTPSPGGAPVLEGVAAWIDCVLESENVVGDHYFVVGRVEDLRADEGVSDAMIFFRGKVAGVTAERTDD